MYKYWLGQFLERDTRLSPKDSSGRTIMLKHVTYLPRGQRFMNAVVVTMVRLVMTPGVQVMCVPGRRSGKT
jgi:hypothetical protein